MTVVEDMVVDEIVVDVIVLKVMVLPNDGPNRSTMRGMVILVGVSYSKSRGIHQQNTVGVYS